MTVIAYRYPQMSFKVAPVEDDDVISLSMPTRDETLRLGGSNWVSHAGALVQAVLCFVTFAEPTKRSRRHQLESSVTASLNILFSTIMFFGT